MIRFTNIVAPTLLLLTAAASNAPAQNLVQNPWFQSSANWSIVNPTLTQIVRWNPVAIETKVDKYANAGQTVGILQRITVPGSGYYQLMIHVDTWQLGQTGGIPFRARLKQGTTVALEASGYSNEGPDTRMVTGTLKAGTYDLEITTTTVYDSNASNYYRLVGNACFLFPVTLPAANWHLESVPFGPKSIVIRGTFGATSDSAIYLFSTKALSTGVKIPGFGGLLWLDPLSASGIVVSDLMPKTTSFAIYPWTTAWPQVHCQIMELKTTGTLTLTLGSPAYSQY
ncbi:MAG: hypothetical protein KDC95_17310 [Planctomycetes bacterium]|nr:hypothetical protein [Planctomycetota bacterium]